MINLPEDADQINQIIALVLIAIGFFFAGLKIGYRNEMKLRITIVRLEHQLARWEEREPRDIDTII